MQIFSFQISDILFLFVLKILIELYQYNALNNINLNYENY